MDSTDIRIIITDIILFASLPISIIGVDQLFCKNSSDLTCSIFHAMAAGFYSIYDSFSNPYIFVGAILIIFGIILYMVFRRSKRKDKDEFEPL